MEVLNLAAKRLLVSGESGRRLSKKLKTALEDIVFFCILRDRDKGRALSLFSQEESYLKLSLLSGSFARVPTSSLFIYAVSVSITSEPFLLYGFVSFIKQSVGKSHLASDLTNDVTEQDWSKLSLIY